MYTPARIVAIGARTAVGLCPRACVAAIRGCIARVQEHPWLVGRSAEPMHCVLDPRLPADMPHLERLLEMGQHCVDDVETQLDERHIRAVPLLMALPEYRPGWTASTEDRLVEKLAVRQGVLQISSTQVVAGGLKALQLALQLIERGEHEACLVGGLDSYFEPQPLKWLIDNDQIVGDGSRSAFIPGEGAGFLLVTHPNLARRFESADWGGIRAVGLAQESRLIKTDVDNLGEGLTTAVRSSIDGRLSAHETIGSVFNDINGERYRTEEYGFMALRAASHFRDVSDYTYPSCHWGDVGAATGTLLTMLAVASQANSGGPLSLVTAGSERGLRAAALLEQAQRG